MTSDFQNYSYRLASYIKVEKWKNKFFFDKINNFWYVLKRKTWVEKIKKHM